MFITTATYPRAESFLPLAPPHTTGADEVCVHSAGMWFAVLFVPAMVCPPSDGSSSVLGAAGSPELACNADWKCGVPPGTSKYLLCAPQRGEG